MSSPVFDDQPLVHSVLHPTDFSEASKDAFAHALAMALLRKTELTLLHVDEGDEGGRVWHSFPAVRGTLQRWGLLEEGSPTEAVFEKLGVRVKKVALRGKNTVAAILAYLEDEPTDLIVLSTRGSEGMPRWIQPSVSESVARKSRTMTLFVPSQSRGMVSLNDGKLSLSRILLPAVREPNPGAAALFATRVAGLVGSGDVEIALLHVGEDLPDLELPESDAWHWSAIRREGPVVEQILEHANEPPADLIVMATAGHQGFLDALRGSTTEQVLRQAPCPVLAVPSD